MLTLSKNTITRCNTLWCDSAIPSMISFNCSTWSPGSAALRFSIIHLNAIAVAHLQSWQEHDIFLWAIERKGSHWRKTLTTKLLHEDQPINCSHFMHALNIIHTWANVACPEGPDDIKDLIAFVSWDLPPILNIPSSFNPGDCYTVYAFVSTYHTPLRKIYNSQRKEANHLRYLMRSNLVVLLISHSSAWASLI